MAIINLNGTPYFSYATVAQADQALFPQPDTAAWFALSSDDKGKHLVAASSWLDSLNWKAECSPQSVRETKLGVVNATIFLANAIANGNTAFLGGTVQEAGTKRLKAGSAEIEYFANISSFTANPNSPLTNVPPYIRSLIIGCLSGSGSGIGGAISYGTHYPSSANDPWDYSK